MCAEPEGESSRQLSTYQSRELIELGFDPGHPVYEISAVGFGLDLVKQALFHSVASNPVVLPLVVTDQVTDTELPAEFRRREFPVPMVVEAVRVFYPPDIFYPDQEQALGCVEQPEWYVRGYLHKAPLNPDPDRIRLNAYIRAKESDIDVVLLQLVRWVSPADPSTVLVWGEGIPGQD